MNKYNNELTEFIELLVKWPIHDIIGNITGDVKSAEIPSNVPNEDITINVETSLGPMEIIKTDKQLTFIRRTSTVIEEYTLELNTMPTSHIVKGTILEIREQGVILTELIREYDYCNHDDMDMRLSSSLETRSDYSYEQIGKLLPNLAIESYSFEQKQQSLESIFGYLKYLSSLAEAKDILPLIRTTIKLNLPGYIGMNNRVGDYNQPFKVTIAGEDFTSSYDFIKGNKSLERINDLMHGIITSENISDIDVMLNQSKQDSAYAGLNLLENHFRSSSSSIYEDSLYKLEYYMLGSGKLSLPQSYFEFLKKLVLEKYKVNLSDNPSRSDVINLIKKSPEVYHE